jgi:glycosyltransferase 2 family protein
MSPAAPPSAAAGSRAPLLLARLLLAAALLAYVLTRVDWSRVADYRHTVSWPWLAAFVLLIPLGHLISSAKWQMLLSAGGHRVGLWRLTGLYTAGQFYNAVFPSTIGGDVVRSLGLRRLIGDARAAFASTVAERFTGAAVLVALGGVATLVALPGLLATRDGAIDGRLAALMAVGAMGAATLAIVAVLSERTLLLLRRALPSLEPVQRGLEKLERFQRALIEYRDQPAVMARAIAWSVLFYISTIGLIYAGCRMTGAPGAQVGVLDAAVITPIILLIALLPLTPGGYGVVQWGYMVTFAALDIPGGATLGVFVSLMLTACSIGVSAAGYALYTLYNALEAGRRRPEAGRVTDTP